MFLNSELFLLAWEYVRSTGFQMILKLAKKGIRGQRKVGAQAGSLDGHFPVQRAKLAEVWRSRGRCFHRPEKSPALSVPLVIFIYIFSLRQGQTDLKLPILLPLPPKYWNYKYVLPYSPLPHP